MYNFLIKKGQLLAFGLGLGVTLIFIILAYSGMGEFNMLTEDDQKLSNNFNFGLTGSMVLIVVCVLVAVLGSVWGLISNPKGSLKMLAGFAGLVAVFAIFYAISDAESAGKLGETIDREGVNDGISRLVSAGLKTSFTLIIAAFGSFILTELWNLVK